MSREVVALGGSIVHVYNTYCTVFLSLSFACWSVKTKARSPMQPFVVLSRNGALPDETENRGTTRAIMGPLWLLVGDAKQQEIT